MSSSGTRALGALFVGVALLSLLALPKWMTILTANTNSSAFNQGTEISSGVVTLPHSPPPLRPVSEPIEDEVTKSQDQIQGNGQSLAERIRTIKEEFATAMRPEVLAGLQLMQDVNIWPLVHGKSFGSKPLYISPDFKFMLGQEDAEISDTVEMFEKEILNSRLHRSTSLSCILASNTVESVQFILIERAKDQYDAAAGIPTIENERYALYMQSNGAVLEIYSRFALVRALASLAQLIVPQTLSETSSACIRPQISSVTAPFLIVDQPAFAYRGLLLDTARNFFSTDSILRIVRTLGMTKMNVLHWHFVDDQSYGFESRAVPGITLSTYLEDTKNEQTYSFADIRRVVEEGRKWGVRIIPELDMPSHAAGWANVDAKSLGSGDSLLTKCPRYTCSKAWGIAMNPYSNTTWQVLERVLREITELFPDPELHLGGDEVFKACWEEDPAITGVSPHTDVHWAHFERHLDRIMQRMNRTVIRWEDCKRFYEEGVVTRKDVTFQIWTGWGDLQKLIRNGYGLLGSQKWYLDNDCMSWEECYSTSPLVALNFPQELVNNQRLIGLETCAWELNEQNLESENLWMRFLGVAEQMWSANDFAAGGTTRGRLIPIDNSGATKRRIMHLCDLLTDGMKLFSREMCSPEANQRKTTIKRARDFHVREAKRDAMICQRLSNPRIPCTTNNCVREHLNR